MSSSAHFHFVRRILTARRLIAKIFFRILGPLNSFFQPGKKIYSIKAGYHHAKSALDFDDRGNRDEWQKDVYLFASSIMKERNFSSVIDFGCGSAYKLINYLGEYVTTGIDLPEITQWLVSKYPERKWVTAPVKDHGVLEADLIICSDTIEHIEKPEKLIEEIRNIKSSLILFSTPERNGIAGKYDFGPPENPSH